VELLALPPGTELAPWCSLGHHLGQRHDPVITDCAAFWALGNTPFEREAAYRCCVGDGLAPARAAALADAVHKGWAVGDAEFLATLALQTHRPVQPRPRGRPPRRA
jgi:putative transposase